MELTIISPYLILDSEVQLSTPSTTKADECFRNDWKMEQPIGKGREEVGVAVDLCQGHPHVWVAFNPMHFITGFNSHRRTKNLGLCWFWPYLHRVSKNWSPKAFIQICQGYSCMIAILKVYFRCFVFCEWKHIFFFAPCQTSNLPQSFRRIYFCMQPLPQLPHPPLPVHFRLTKTRPLTWQ